MKTLPMPAATTSRTLARAIMYCVGAILLLALAASCATTRSSDSLVKQRAQALWDAILAKDYDTAYALYSPGYRSSHTRVDFEIYLRTRRVRWTSAEVQEASCKADVCTVTALLGYSVAGAVPGVPMWKSKKKLEETWVRTQGQWWFLPEE